MPLPQRRRRRGAVNVDDDDKNDGERDGVGDVLTVTALGAAHIAGAKMFVFELSDKCVVHTGDFRFDDAVFADRWRAAVGQKRIDQVPNLRRCLLLFAKTHRQLIVDNTFLAPMWSDFPTRRESIAKVLQREANLRNETWSSFLSIFFEHVLAVIEAKLAVDPNAVVFLGLDNIGYEPIFEAIALRFGEPICVPLLLFVQLQEMLAADVALDDEDDNNNNNKNNIINNNSDNNIDDISDTKGYYRDADCRRRNVYTRDATKTRFFVVPYQLCADAASAAQLDAGRLVGALRSAQQTRATARSRRQQRLHRTGRTNSPTSKAIDAAAAVAFAHASTSGGVAMRAPSDDARRARSLLTHVAGRALDVDWHADSADAARLIAQRRAPTSVR